MKRIETAAAEVLQLSDARKITIQEFTARQAVKTIGKFRAILALLKERDVLNLGQMRTENDELDLTKAIDWADVVLEIVEQQFDSVTEIILNSQVEGKGETVLTDDDFDVLQIGDVVELLKSVYRVNVVEGSLKKTLEPLTKKLSEMPAVEESEENSNEPLTVATR